MINHMYKVPMIVPTSRSTRYYFDVVEVELTSRKIGQQKGFSNYLENVQRPTSLQSFGTS